MPQLTTADFSKNRPLGSVSLYIPPSPSPFFVFKSPLVAVAAAAATAAAMGGGGVKKIKMAKSPLAAAAATAAGRGKKKCLKASWRWCYYLHRSRYSLSPICGTFEKKSQSLGEIFEKKIYP